jgi:hypothetical protein
MTFVDLEEACAGAVEHVLLVASDALGVRRQRERGPALRLRNAIVLTMPTPPDCVYLIRTMRVRPLGSRDRAAKTRAAIEPEPSYDTQSSSY